MITLLSVVNVVMLAYVAIFVGRKVLAGEQLPLITTAGLVFFAFLDWLLVEWFWDPVSFMALAGQTPARWCSC